MFRGTVSVGGYLLGAVRGAAANIVLTATAEKAAEKFGPAAGAAVPFVPILVAVLGRRGIGGAAVRRFTRGSSARATSRTAQYEKWRSELPTRPAPTTRPGAYQRKYAGDIERQVTGEGEKFFVDGLRDSTILETKLVQDATKSPFISGSNIPAFLRSKIVGEVEDEFARMAKILEDPTNPLKSVEVIVSDKQAVSFFQNLLRKYGITGKVVVKPE
jgi:hypothetical protein